MAAFLDGVEHGAADQEAGGVHGAAVVGRAPGAGVDVVVVEIVVHGDGLVGVRDEL